MNIAIIGAGLLARSIAESLRSLPEIEGIVLGHDAVDVTSIDSLARALEPHKPDVIVNTAAFHSLAGCEADPERAHAVNAKGAANVAQLAPTIYVSTDYVFNDGGPHEESLPGRQPRSVYGRTKLAGELATLEHDGIVVRVAGLYGRFPSRKGPTFPEQVLASHDPMTLPTDQRFSPTNADDAAERIADLANALGSDSYVCWLRVPCRHGGPQGIFHAANDGATNWAEFAEYICAVAGHERHILPMKAKDPLRPKNSALVSTRLQPLRHWSVALTEYIAEKKGWPPRVSPLR